MTAIEDRSIPHALGHYAEDVVERLAEYLDKGYSDSSNAPSLPRVLDYIREGEELADAIFSLNAPDPDRLSAHERKRLLCALAWYLTAIAARKDLLYVRGITRLIDHDASLVSDWLRRFPECYPRYSSHFPGLSLHSMRKAGQWVGLHYGIDLTPFDRDRDVLPADMRTLLFSELTDATVMLKTESHGFDRKAAYIARRILRGQRIKAKHYGVLDRICGEELCKRICRGGRLRMDERRRIRHIAREPRRHAIEWLAKLIGGGRDTKHYATRREDADVLHYFRKYQRLKNQLSMLPDADEARGISGLLAATESHQDHPKVQRFREKIYRRYQQPHGDFSLLRHGDEILLHARPKK